MKALAYALITIGFLFASLVTVQTTGNEVVWGRYLPGLLLGIAGVVLVRVSVRCDSHQASLAGAGIQELRASLAKIVSNITQLNGDKQNYHPSDIHAQIDELFRNDLDAFAENRESISHSYGLEAYAAMMNEFAAGERYLNRVWSASVDGYVDEVNEYLERAMHQFKETDRVLRHYLRSDP